MHVSITFIAGNIRAAQTIVSGKWEPDYDVEEVDGADYFDGIREEETDPEKIWLSELFDTGPADSSGISRIRLSGEKCRAKVKRTVEAANTLAGLMEKYGVFDPYALFAGKADGDDRALCISALNEINSVKGKIGEPYICYVFPQDGTESAPLDYMMMSGYQDIVSWFPEGKEFFLVANRADSYHY